VKLESTRTTGDLTAWLVPARAGAVYRAFIPLDPVPTARPRFTRTGKAHAYDKQSRKRRAFIKALAFCTPGELPFFEGPIQLNLTFNIARPKSHFRTGKNSDKLRDSAPPYPTKSDIDNYSKFVMDCLNGKLFKDDRQVVRLVAEKQFSPEPSTEIEIREVSIEKGQSNGESN